MLTVNVGKEQVYLIVRNINRTLLHGTIAIYDGRIKCSHERG